MKAKRNHKKRHGVNRRKSLYARRAHARRVRLQQEASSRARRHRAIMRLYWSGSVADLDEATRAVDEARRSAA